MKSNIESLKKKKKTNKKKIKNYSLQLADTTKN